MSKDNPREAFDSLFKDSTATSNDVVIEESMLPCKCMTCITANVCSPINTYVQLIKIGIKIEVQSCPYYKELRPATTSTR